MAGGKTSEIGLKVIIQNSRILAFVGMIREHSALECLRQFGATLALRVLSSLLFFTQALSKKN